MKQLAAAILLTVLPLATIQAADPDPQRKFCADVHNLSESIMRARQANAAMPAAMERAAGIPFVEALVRDAYSRPRFNTPEHQQRAIQDFANDNYGACLGRQ